MHPAAVVPSAANHAPCLRSDYHVGFVSHSCPVRHVYVRFEPNLQRNLCLDSHFIWLSMASSSSTVAIMNGTAPKITFWTNHGCPWAQRVQIVLRELGLAYEEVIIDLDTPREEWYLKINPVSLGLRGLGFS